MDLKPRLKCVVKFLRDKCDAAGVWQPNWTLAQTYIKDKVSEEEVLEIDGGKQFKKLPTGQIYCIGFVNFQYGELSEKCPPHKKVISLLKKFNLENDRVLLGYQNPIDRVQEKEEEKEKDKEEEMEKEKEGQKSNDIETRKAKFLSEVSLFRNQYSDTMLKEFYEYWSEQSPGAEKFRKEFEKVFDLDRRLKTWSKNQNKFSKNGKLPPTAADYDRAAEEIFGKD